MSMAVSNTSMTTHIERAAAALLHDQDDQNEAEVGQRQVPML